MGALLAARLAKEVEQNVRRKGTPTVHFWTDSQIILFWIKGPYHKWKQFVSNLVKKIQALSNPEAFSHIPGKLNIADLVTRGASVKDLLKNETWSSGPEFLRKNEVSVFQGNNSVPEEYYISELKKGSCVEEDIPLCFAVTNQNVLFYNDLLKITNSFSKLIRIVSCVFRFIYNCRNPKDKNSGYLKCQELNNSEFVLLKFAQSEYSEEISALIKDEQLVQYFTEETIDWYFNPPGSPNFGGLYEA
ncbi:uncharacterized protein LOC118199252, partial [Stegodyphus dumicola]|uniref:uncharacterized protein LOC118199252 n=1 Tax=Stegodyphus dumicola TaxID=202533 RepID=UPI0015AF4DA5